MERRFSQFAGRLRPSAIRSLTRQVQRSDGKKMISFAGGLPHPDTFPHAELAEIAAEILGRESATALQYGITQGYPPLVEVMIEYMAGRGVTGVKPEEVLIAAGSQQAIDLVGRIFIDPGDVILMESPGYVGAISAFQHLGARPVGIAVGADGPDLDALEAAARKHHPKFFYTTPNFANPAGVMFTPEKRRAICEVARKHDFWIVEDDAYGELFFTGATTKDMTPAKACDPDGRVIYMQTFSKTIAPGLRVAAIVGPAEPIALIEKCKQAADMFTGTLTQRLAFEFVKRGHFAKRLPGLRKVYEGKCQAMVEALRKYIPAARFEAPRGGFFIWLELPGGVDAQALLAPTMDAGVVYVPGAPFFPEVEGENPFRSAARLSYSREAETDIVQGIKTIGALVDAACLVSSR